MKFNDLTGRKFGRLSVMRRLPYRIRGDLIGWECACDCGSTVCVSGSALSTGNTKSCGCFRVDSGRAALTKHGLSSTRLYRIWGAIKNRCYNPKDGCFHRYGGRGITVAPEWRHDFEAFRSGVGDPPTDAHSIDRIDNDGNYAPGNVRWATPIEQARKTRRSVMVNAFGETKCVSEWAEDPRCKAPYSAVLDRIQKFNWPPEMAISEPTRLAKARSRNSA
jgi:hypothetical protein